MCDQISPAAVDADTETTAGLGLPGANATNDAFLSAMPG
jgi:hypothetical protein